MKFPLLSFTFLGLDIGWGPDTALNVLALDILLVFRLILCLEDVATVATHVEKFHARSSISLLRLEEDTLGMFADRACEI